jgi:hypothetical protein
MNFLKHFEHRIESFRVRHSPAAWLAALWLTAAFYPSNSSLAQESYVDEPGTQVLTRGPVHEAFAGAISYDSVPGIVVKNAPPALIEEIPPEERPVGEDVAWIPGYWAWDDERNDFLWISGIWRALPPGREWIVGYWAETTEGYQWTSGYWADVTTTETTYLPPPPRSVEEGPNIEAPSRNFGWTPGNWIWSQERYAWSPGYWAEGRSDWDWIPAHYVWTRRGYVFVDGYWDHPVQRRGVLFAPVYFDRGVYSRPSYTYSPSVVINLAVLASHLFLRPQYDHYYFGDYYAPRYGDNGFYSSHSYQSSRRGYDPIYAHQRWENRDNQDWERGIERDYQYRRDEESARPPHTWAAQRLMDGGKADVRRKESRMATSFAQMTKQEELSNRFQKVDKDDRGFLARRGQDVQKSREERRIVEGTVAEGKREDGKTKASKVPSSRSPIAAKEGKDEKQRGGAPEPRRKPSAGDKSGPDLGPNGNPQKQPVRPSVDGKGKDKKVEKPETPKDRPQQSPTEPKTGRTPVDEKGKAKKGDGREETKSKAQQSAPQERPDRWSAGDKGGKKNTDAPQQPKGKSEKPAPPPQTDRRENEAKSKGAQAAPRPPQTKRQPAQRPAKVERSVPKDKGKKEDEESKGKKKSK